MAKSNDREIVTAVIASGGSLSAPVPLGGKAVIGIMPPTGSGAFDALTVYHLFSVSADGTTYSLLRDKDGGVIYVTIAENNTYGAMPLDPSEFAAWSFVKVATYRTDKTTVQTQTPAASADTYIPLIIAGITG
jgi:hypothetical protein